MDWKELLDSELVQTGRISKEDYKNVLTHIDGGIYTIANIMSLFNSHPDSTVRVTLILTTFNQLFALLLLCVLNLNYYKKMIEDNELDSCKKNLMEILGSAFDEVVKQTIKLKSRNEIFQKIIDLSVDQKDKAFYQ